MSGFDNADSAISTFYPDGHVEMNHEEEAAARDAAALKSKTSAAAAAEALSEQEQEQERCEHILKQQRELDIRSYKNPHELYTKKWWRWDQYGDDSHMDCKTCGERVNFVSWAHCSDRCLIDDVGYDVYQEAMRVSGGMKQLRNRPG